jgi:hypothetical protein
MKLKNKFLLIKITGGGVCSLAFFGYISKKKNIYVL